MNSPESDDIGRQLATWRLSPTISENFRPRVWERIRAVEQATWVGYLRTHAAPVALALVLAVMASSVAGNVLGHRGVDAAREQMVKSYLVELDPRLHASLLP